jgi:GNAT superfamily N-acetyltransferase
MDSIELRLMEEADFGEIVALMAGAFFHSTLYAWAAPDEGERRRLLNAMFHRRARSWLEGESQTELALESGKIVGSATWVPPKGDEPPGVGPGSMDEVFQGLSPEVAERWMLFQPVIEAQDKSMPQPCWDLAPIAVTPEAQGRGIGTLLLRRKLGEIDRAAQRCFLATQDRANLGLYEHFGFRQIEEIPIVPDGPVSYSMIRDVRAGN